jgi:flavin-binding protein dodecin
MQTDYLDLFTPLRTTGNLRSPLGDIIVNEGKVQPPHRDGRKNISNSKRASREGVTQEELVSVATVTEISAISQQGFEDAVQQGVARANKTLRNIEGCWVKDMNVMIEDGNITGYKVNLEVTFVLEDTL